MKLLREVQGMRYELFDIHALDDMAIVIADAFAGYEPMAVDQSVSREELVDFVKLFGTKAAQEGLTVVARDRETRKIIGAMLTDDFASAPPKGIERTSGKFRPILALLDELDAQYKQGKSLQIGEYLHLFMIAVAGENTGKNVARNLIAACLENGIQKGYQVAVTEATGMTSQHIFRKLGFVDRLLTSYKTFEYLDKRVFASINGHTGTILLDKVLASIPDVTQ